MSLLLVWLWQNKSSIDEDMLQWKMTGREDETAVRVAQEKMIEQFGRFIEVFNVIAGNILDG